MITNYSLLISVSRSGLLTRIIFFLNALGFTIQWYRSFPYSFPHSVYIWQNLNDNNSVDEVTRKVWIHGFDEHGMIQDITCLTRERVDVLVDELEETIRPSQTLSPTYAKEGGFGGVDEGGAPGEYRPKIQGGGSGGGRGGGFGHGGGSFGGGALGNAPLE
ncbi:unnamed protein product [Calypogeia fissa]